MSALVIALIAAGYLAGASVAYACFVDVFDDDEPEEGALLFVSVMLWPGSLVIAIPIVTGRRLNHLAKQRRAAKELPRAEVRK